VVSKPKAESSQPAAESKSTPEVTAADYSDDEEISVPAGERQEQAAEQTNARRRRQAGGFGLRAKMLLLFLLIPMITVAGAGLFYLWQLETLPDVLVRESVGTADKATESEFSEAVKSIHFKARTFTEQARMITWALLGGMLLLLGLIVYTYSHRLTGKLKSLTEVADRIGEGDLEVDIAINSKDEIGRLAEAIARMRESIRLSKQDQQQTQ
jgi:HAMP domain-containing protein